MTLSINPDWCDTASTSWSALGDSMIAQANRLPSWLASLELDGVIDGAAPTLATAGSEMLRSGFFIGAVASETVAADGTQIGFDSDDLQRLIDVAFGGGGRLTADDRRRMRRIAAAYDEASALREEIELGLVWVDPTSLADRIAQLDIEVQVALMTILPDPELAKVMNLVDYSMADREQFLVDVGENASLATWRRMGEHSESINPSPATGISDSARETPAKVEWFEELVYADFSDLTLYGDVNGALNSGPDGGDLRQGAIGDCYLIAAMITLAFEHPGLASPNIAANANGTYTVTFADGSRQVVSPDLPVHPDQPTTMVFARTDATPSLYPGLLEKAYAQQAGGYGEITGGRSNEAIEVLTGREGDWIDNDEIDLTDLEERFNRGESLGLSTIDRPSDMTNDEWLADSETPDPFVTTQGPGPWTDDRFGKLHQNHAFIVVDVDTSTGTVSVINPWKPDEQPVVLSEDDLIASVNGVYVNESP